MEYYTARKAVVPGYADFGSETAISRLGFPFCGQKNTAGAAGHRQMHAALSFGRAPGLGNDGGIASKSIAQKQAIRTWYSSQVRNPRKCQTSSSFQPVSNFIK